MSQAPKLKGLVRSNRPRNQPTLRPCAADPAPRVVTMEALLQVGGRLPRSLLAGRRQQTHCQSGTLVRARRQHPRPSLLLTAFTFRFFLSLQEMNEKGIPRSRGIPGRG